MSFDCLAPTERTTTERSDQRTSFRKGAVSFPDAAEAMRVSELIEQTSTVRPTLAGHLP